MTLIRMTSQLAEVMLVLQSGGYLIDRGDDIICTNREKDKHYIILEDLFQALKKAKLVQKTDRSVIYQYYAYRKAFRVSETGAALKIPPAKFWLTE